jgi:hypothetical protein
MECEDVSWIRLAVTGCSEHGNERSDSRKGGEFLELLSYYQLLAFYIAP